MTTRIHTPKHSKVQLVFARDVLGDDENPNENNALAVWIFSLRTMGSQVTGGSEIPEPREKQSQPPPIGGRKDDKNH